MTLVIGDFYDDDDVHNIYEDDNDQETKAIIILTITMSATATFAKFSPSRPSFAPRPPSLQSYRPPRIATYLMIEISPMAKTDC